MGVTGGGPSSEGSGNAVPTASNESGLGSGDVGVDGKAADSCFVSLGEGMLSRTGARSAVERSSCGAGNSFVTDSDF